MPDLSNDIRLAVDSGETLLGINGVKASIRSNTAKVVVVAVPNKQEFLQDLVHLCKLSGPSCCTSVAHRQSSVPSAESPTLWRPFQ